MADRKTSRLPALVLALGLAGLAPGAQALTIVLKDAGKTAMSSQQFSALRTAADYWQGQLSDNVTVYLSVSFADLGSNVLGSTTIAHTTVSYSDMRSLLAADVHSATDVSAVSHLQTGKSLSFIATQPNLSTRLDNDGSINNSYLYLTSANAKALGLSTPTDAGSPDATLSFANAFASSFAYSRVNGQVPGNKTDFITVAEHEIGHALGFISGVDDIDYCLDHASQCGTTSGFETSPWYYALDLFRYAAPGVLNVAVGGSPYFSVDGGATHLQSFATGVAHGDGNQASHFSASVLTLMRPFVGNGQSYDATTSDLTALDAIGWNLAATAVPEPQSWALLLGGLAAVGGLRRLRRSAA